MGRMGKPLTAEQLVDDFGAKTAIARLGVQTIYEALDIPRSPALAGWAGLLGRATGRSPSRPWPGAARAAAGYGIDAGRFGPDAFLLALQTYYAMVVRRLLSRFLGLPKTDSAGEDLFKWHLTARSGPVRQLTDRMAGAMAEYNLGPFSQDGTGKGDLFKRLYQELFPKALRHELGEYYTPDWLARHVLDQAGFDGNPDRRLLDPACGSGTFLVTAIQRILERCPEVSGADLCRKILANVVGFDLNPLAVMTARANYLIALAGLLPDAGEIEIPVYLADSILDERGDGPFDCVVGNPPWITWDNLPDDYREATKPLWNSYGLFSLSGNEARHGGGKKDLSMLMLAVSADRYLRRGGRLAMVVTQTLFQTKGAGDGFRRFQLGDEGERLKVLRVDDMVAMKPFDAANWTSTISLEKGAPTQYPVTYVKWLPAAGGEKGADTSCRNGPRVSQRTYLAEPIEPSRPGSPWFLRPEGLQTPLDRLVGPSGYAAHLGANSGGANGVYWDELVEKSGDGILVRNIAQKSKRDLDRVERPVEPHLLYPLARWGDVSRWCVKTSAHIILAQDVTSRSGIREATMRQDYPLTYEYLRRFERVLRARAAYKRYQGTKPFYSMYNVDTFTVAPIKVVWRRMDKRINAAVAGPVDDPLLGRRPVVPQETCVLVECGSTDEAHYVCAVLNSSVADFLVASHSVHGGKGFGTPGMLDYVRLRRFDPQNRRHAELAACSRTAHRIVAEGIAPDIVQRQIDELAAELWGLKEKEFEAICREQAFLLGS